MSSSGSIGDPRTGRDRRVPTKARTFKDGTIDPVTQHRRPLLTWGNAILVAVMIGFGLYATGNFPQLDAFFDNLDKQARGRNDVVVHALITYGPFLFGAVIFAVFGLFVFLFINSRRRQLSDPKGWHKVADRAPERRQRDRREDLPSMVMPIGKERPNRRTTDSPARTPITAKTDGATPAAAEAVPPAVAKETTPAPNSAKAEAIAAAAKAEAELDAASADLPSFVMPLGKTRNPQPTPSPIEIAKIAAPTPAPTEPSRTAATTTETSSLAAAAAAAKVDAAIAAAKAAAAKAEAAIAAAKAEAAIAEAAMAAAQAEAKALPS